MDEAENAEESRKARAAANNRFHLELERQGKIGAIDKQVGHTTQGFDFFALRAVLFDN